MEHYSRRKWCFLSLLFLLLLGGTALSQQAQSQTVYVWGRNDYGQLGDGTYTRRTPRKNPNFTGFVSITSGATNQTFTLMSDGTVWGTGYNYYGALGLDIIDRLNVPTPIPGLSNIVQIAPGGFHTLALRSDGTVWASGWNAYGQLGNGNNEDSYGFIQVPDLTDVVQVAAGFGHSLALKSDGTVWAWGWNGNGQLGIGTNDNSNVPIQIETLDGVASVAAGEQHSLAIKKHFDAGGGEDAPNTVWAWGWNQYGQLGDGTTEDKNTPVNCVPVYAGVKQVVAGRFHSAALRSGQVLTWGRNNVGQLGEAGIDQRTFLEYVPNLFNITSLASGGFHMLALNQFGAVKAWGDNSYGQLGDKTRTNRFEPIQLALNGITQITGGWYHSAAIQSIRKVVISVPNVVSPYGSTVLSATVTDAVTGAPITGESANFSVDGVSVDTASTDANGTASTVNLWIPGGKHKVTVALQSNYFTGAGKGNLTVTKVGARVSNKNVKAKRSTAITLSAFLKQASDGKPISGRTVNFFVNGEQVGTGTTDANGVATLAYTTPSMAGTYPTMVTFDGDNSYLKSSYSKATLTVK